MTIIGSAVDNKDEYTLYYQNYDCFYFKEQKIYIEINHNILIKRYYYNFKIDLDNNNQITLILKKNCDLSLEGHHLGKIINKIKLKNYKKLVENSQKVGFFYYENDFDYYYLYMKNSQIFYVENNEKLVLKLDYNFINYCKNNLIIIKKTSIGLKFGKLSKSRFLDLEKYSDNYFYQNFPLGYFNGKKLCLVGSNICVKINDEYKILDLKIDDYIDKISDNEIYIVNNKIKIMKR